jgi:hypothetical protein
MFYAEAAEDLRRNREQFIQFYAEAAEDLRRNREQFIQNVRTSLRGGHVKGVEYDSVVTSSR